MSTTPPGIASLNLQALPTPCFVLDVAALRANLAVLDIVQRRTGAKILLAQKAFSMYAVYPLLREVLHGVCASSPHEARLGREEFGREVHAFAAAYSERDVRELLTLCDHLLFNSFGQWRRFRDLCRAHAGRVSYGLRVNPEHSEAVAEMYSPCAPKSRLGIKREAFVGEDLDGISGLHFHTLCQQNADALERTVAAFEARFGEFIPQMRWINFGGGHHITRADYDVDRLCRIIDGFRQRHGTETIYLEPGEAVALNAGSLVATVLETTATPECRLSGAHIPALLATLSAGDRGADQPGEFAHDYRLAGHSCLAGDVIGDYSFPQPLAPGDKIELLDMAIYSMVKTNTFNGLALPSIATWDSDSRELKIIRQFGYEDFKGRLS